MARWEYRLLVGIWVTPGGMGTDHPRLYEFTKEGGQQLITDFKKRSKGVQEREAVTRMIAQLGEEGWMMTESYYDNKLVEHSYMWFRRAIQ